MCYSAEKSLETLIINHISSLLLYYTYDPIMGMFFLYVGFMQFFDYMFWTNQEKNNTNYWCTKLAMMENNSQPIVLALFISYFTNSWLYLYEIVTVTIYSIIAFFYGIYSWYHIDYTLVTKNSSPGLFWQWNYLPGGLTFYMLFLITICILFIRFTYPMNYIFIFISIISFILSWYKYKKNKSVGRMWCFFTGYLPIFMMFLYMILDKKQVKRMLSI